MTQEHPTGTVTLVFTDIEGSSALWERHGSNFRPIVDEHNRLLREIAARHDGVEVRSMGDGFFLSFARASDAVRCAVAMQQAVAAQTWRAGERALDLKVRIGMHSGEAQALHHPTGALDYYSAAVNRAARVGAAAQGGQILVAETARLLAAPQLDSDFQWLDLGRHFLKGIGEEHLWQVGFPGLQRDFAALPTAEAGRHNLPLPATPFVGREAAIALWRRLLLDPATRLLTLSGPGGIGKSRAALQLAHGCAAGRDFEGGVWWIDLAEDRSGAAMIQRIAQGLNFYFQTPPSAKEQLWNFLRGQQILLVLDNTEQIPDAPEIIHELLAAPGLKCLVTTRRALGLQAERQVEVLPLPLAEAQHLFIERAKTRDASFALTSANAADVSELCQRLEGVPLALELAASRLAGMAPREILGRLSERFRLLQSRAPDLPPRQRALRGVIDWSYELLGEDERALFAQLAVFARGFSLEDAEAVCEVFDVFEGVLELRRQSLLRGETDPATQQTRYAMLEAVRDYAAEKLRDLPDGPQVRRRHAVHFLSLAQAHLGKLRTPAEAAALSELEAIFGNLRAALDWAAAEREPSGAALALAMGLFLQRRGFHQEALRLIQSGLDLTPPHDAILRARLLRECAGLHYDGFEWDIAQRRASEALALFEQAGDLEGQAEAHNVAGLAALGAGNFGRARACFQRALQLFEQAGALAGQGAARTNLGAVEHEDPAGSAAAAARHWQDALDLRRQSGDRRGLAEITNNLGIMAQDRGALDEARRFYKESLDFEHRLSHIFGVARALFNLGEVAGLQDQAACALRLCAAAECLFDKVGSPYTSYARDLFEQAAARLEAEPRGLEDLRLGLKDKSLDELVAWALATLPGE